MKKTVRDVDVKGKRCLVRCDFNVPLDADGKITDSTRIDASLPTLNYLLEQGASLILLSHLGRPDGTPDAKYSLAPVAAALEKDLARPVFFRSAPDVIDAAVEEKAAALKPGEVMLLENTRFVAGETKNDPAFAKALAGLGDLFVNDAFGSAHRAHASTTGIADYLPAVSGLLLEKEVQFLGDALEKPKRPFVAVLGGAKVADKIQVIRALLAKVDTLLIGGGMAYTFLKAEGYEIGTSLLDQESIGLAADLMAEAKKKGVDLLLPQDVVAATEFAPDAKLGIYEVEHIPPDRMGMDIGPATAADFTGRIKYAGTVLWNGPMGVFEMPRFATGTMAVAKAMAEADGITIIGGGDSAAAVTQMGYADKMTHVSTGGGASLEFIEGRTLPGVACIPDA